MHIKMPVPETMCGQPRPPPHTHTTHTPATRTKSYFTHVTNMNVFFTRLIKTKEFAIPVTNTNVFLHLFTWILWNILYLLKSKKLTIRICHTCKNVIYSCEFFTHVWQIRSVKNKIHHGSYDVLDWHSRKRIASTPNVRPSNLLYKIICRF